MPLVAQQLLGESRPARLAVAAERDQRLFAGLGLAARRQHAGRGMARARAGLAAVEHRNLGAAGEPPGNAEPDHAGADNGDARPLAEGKWAVFVPLNAAPFAGMTQTGSTGLISAAPCAAPLADSE